MKILSLAINCVSILLAIIALAVLIPQLFGVRIKTVMSGSMEPDIHVGSIVVTVPSKFEDLNVGDDITYKVNGTFVTHRIVEINREEGVVKTKGVANKTADAPVGEKQIKGKVILSLPEVGFMLQKILKYKVVLYVLMAGALIVSVLPECIKKKKPSRQ